MNSISNQFTNKKYICKKVDKLLSRFKKMKTLLFLKYNAKKEAQKTPLKQNREWMVFLHHVGGVPVACKQKKGSYLFPIHPQQCPCRKKWLFWHFFFLRTFFFLNDGDICCSVFWQSPSLSLLFVKGTIILKVNVCLQKKRNRDTFAHFKELAKRWTVFLVLLLLIEKYVP